MAPSFYAPHVLLQPYVETYIYTHMLGYEMDLIPRGNNQLFFLLNEKHEAVDHSTNQVYSSRFFISSPGTRHYRLYCSEKLASVGIIFKPFGAYRLLGIPQDALLDDFTDMEQVFGQRITEIKHKMEDHADNPTFILQLLEQWLLQQHHQLHKIDVGAMAFACQNIQKENGLFSLDHLAYQTNLSKRSVEYYFKQQIGVSPKMFSRIIRFGHIEKIISTKNQPDFQELYYTFGYYDQAHFIKEFKQFSGYSPSKYHLRIPDLADIV